MGVLVSYFNCRIYENTVIDDIDLSNRGVRLEVLLKICDDVDAGRLKVPSDDKKRSAGERLVDGLVKPVTDTRKCSYATHLWQDPNTRHLVGKCNVFLSHPWSGDFKDTVAALDEWEMTLPKGSPPKFYFVDYFAVNQHSPGADLEQLAELVGLSDTLVLMAKPWKNPVALTRLWCIFEIAHAVLSSTEIEIILGPKEKRNFQQSLRKNVSSISEVLCEAWRNIDSKNAKASKESDIEWIGKFIKNKLGGYKKVDNIVTDAYIKWFERSAESLLKTFPEDDKGSNEYAQLVRYRLLLLFLKTIAVNDTSLKNKILVFREMGQLHGALPKAIKNLENQEKVLGADHITAQA